ncbi:hypothetical protein BROUX41_000648 [Berkeleyomyces rouxiae]|uniref:uncharacterized protein n=1 Tax=Berkeleyomyces rouxiae TaxID=2035830 RepID=UPI003B825C7E
METGDYATNTLVVDNIASINYRLFTLSTDPKRAQGVTAQGLEKSARDAGHIVLFDSRRRALWQFQVAHKDPNPPQSQQTSLTPLESLEFSGFTLSLLGGGTYEPSALSKGRLGPSPAPGTTSQQQQQQQQQQQHQAQDSLTPKPSDSLPLTVSALEAHSVFITALHGTLNTTFAWNVGAIPLNDRTLLVPSDKSSIYDSQASSTATATIQVYLTTAGALLVSISTTVHKGLRLLDKAVAYNQTITDSAVVLAPFGYPGRFRCPDGGIDSLSTHTPYTPALRQTDNKTFKWRMMISTLLHVRGVPPSIIDNAPWVDVQLGSSEGPDPKGTNRNGLIVQWPLKLCIRRRMVCCPPQQSGEDVNDYDALNNAKTWFQEAPERAEKTSRRKADREAQGSMETDSKHPANLQNQVQSHHHQMQNQQPNPQSQQQQHQQSLPLSNTHTLPPSGQSPLNNAVPRSGLNSNNAMYPTPPDGIQGQSTGSLGLPDDALSSPANAPFSNLPIGTSTTALDSWAPSLGLLSGGFNGTDNKMLIDSSESNAELADAHINFFDDKALESVDSISGAFSPAQVAPRRLSHNGQMQPPPLPQQSQLQNQNSVAVASEPGPANPIISMPPPSEFGDIKKQPPDPDTPVFTKPELRHARSLGDNMHQLGSQGRLRAVSMLQNAGNRLKRGASPFGPDTVYKRLRAVVPQASLPLHPAKSRKGNIFDKVSFDSALPEVNSKYAQGGIFSVDRKPAKRSVSLDMSAPPTTSYLRTHGKHRKTPKPYTFTGAPNPQLSHGQAKNQSLVLHITKTMENSSLTTSPVRIGGMDDETQSDADDVSDASDLDDTSMSSDEVTSPVKTTGPRRLGDDMSARGTPGRESEDTESSSAMEPGNLTRIPSPGWAMSKFLSESEPLPLNAQLGGDDLVAIGQILTEQASTGSLKIHTDSQQGLEHVSTHDTRRQSALLARQSMQTLTRIFPKSLRTPTQLNLKSLVDTQDLASIQQAQAQAHVQANAQANAQQQQQQQQRSALRNGTQTRETEKPPLIFTIMPSHLEMRRADTKLSILPTAITFWESLGLGPCKGTKDIKAVCMFPSLPGLSGDVSCFLDRLKIVYESFKLGSFENLTANPGIVDGLVAYEPACNSTTGVAHIFPNIPQSLAERSSAICDALEASTDVNKNYVVFFMYWPSNPATIIEACHAFHRLYEAYRSLLEASGKFSDNELILQLVPVDLISAPFSVVTPQLSDFSQLCIETYDRCSIFNQPMPAPAILLDEPIQRSSIEFKTSAPSESILHENSSIHVAYAKSLDNRWISIAWTDSRGLQQQTASYCLSRKGVRGQEVQWNDVAQDIWQTTIELMAVWKVRWRVVISKCGFMDPSEADCWAQLAKNESKASFYVVLVAVDTAPALQLLPKAVQLSTTVQSATYATPAGTPQASTPSEAAPTPRATGDGSTQAAATHSTPAPVDVASDPDGDGVLIDVAEQTWGAVLSHRLNNSVMPARQNPAAASGYLIKRGGARSEDPPAVLEVSLVSVDGVTRNVDPMLREMLKQFRGLGTLARARGVTEQWDVRPWHIAAAEKSVRALYALL